MAIGLGFARHQAGATHSECMANVGQYLAANLAPALGLVTDRAFALRMVDDCGFLWHTVLSVVGDFPFQDRVGHYRAALQKKWAASDIASSDRPNSWSDWVL